MVLVTWEGEGLQHVLSDNPHRAPSYLDHVTWEGKGLQDVPFEDDEEMITLKGNTLQLVSRNGTVRDFEPPPNTTIDLSGEGQSCAFQSTRRMMDAAAVWRGGGDGRGR